MSNRTQYLLGAAVSLGGALFVIYALSTSGSSLFKDVFGGFGGALLGSGVGFTFSKWFHRM